MWKKALFILVVFFGFMAPVCAKEINLTEDWDMEGTPYEITEDLTINGNGHTITGYFTLPEFPGNKIKLVIKDAIIDGNGNAKIVSMSKANYVGFSVEIDNVDFLNYTKTALDLSGLITSIDIKNSLFDSAATAKIDGIVCEQYCELEKRSASAIDLNLRGSVNSAEGTELCPNPILLGNYNFENNVFKNVVVADADLETSTAGAIKLKIKELHDCLDSVPAVTMTNNKFVNNSRDIVIGTSSVVGESTSVDESGDFDLKLKNNGAITVLYNNLTRDYTERLVSYSEFLSENALIELNAYANVPSFYYLYSSLDDEDIWVYNGSLAKDSHSLILDMLEQCEGEELPDQMNYFLDEANKYILKVNSRDLKRDLTGTVNDATLNVSKTTANSKLKDYEDGSTLFIESNEDGALPAEKIIFSFKTDYDVDTKVYLYYVKENGALEKISDTVIDDKSYASFELKHFSSYVLSDIELLSSNPETGRNGSIILVIALVLATSIIVGFEVKKNRLYE